MPSRIGHTPLSRDAVQALQSWPAPVVAYATDFAPGHDTGPHGHTRAQFVLADEGVMSVWTATGTWLVPPGLAVWIPADVEHAVRAITRARFASLYVDAARVPAAPDAPRVVEVTPLLRELIRRAIDLPERLEEGGRDARLLSVLTDELADLVEVRLHLPMPRDRRAVAVADALISAPGDDTDLEGWSRRVGTSARTVARLFLSETGLGFGTWRQRLRLLAALERLAAGEPVTTIALDLGYRSPSAFSAMFRRTLGRAPTRYLQDR
jgi:AraC-like DNA-binding protein